MKSFRIFEQTTSFTDQSEKSCEMTVSSIASFITTNDPLMSHVTVEILNSYPVRSYPITKGP